VLFRSLEGYAGELGRVKGVLHLGEGLFASGTNGTFEADPSSVTMGEPDLDEALRGSTFLHIAKHSIATFVIQRAEGDGNPIAVGVGTPTQFEGLFTMKGVSIPLSFTAVLTPTISKDGEPRLKASGNFKISLAAFDIEGPDGPPESSNSLEFQFDFVLTPTAP